MIPLNKNRKKKKKKRNDKKGCRRIKDITGKKQKE